jgi:hypothetical protein
MREIRSACATSLGVENNKVPPNVTGQCCRLIANQKVEIKEQKLRVKNEGEGKGLRLGRMYSVPGPCLAALSYVPSINCI